MTVKWKETALDDRSGFLDDAMARAIKQSDPHIHVAAIQDDDRLEAEGNVLDGVATYQQGPLPGTRLYICRSGKYAVIYNRRGNHVEILWIAPTRSNWKGEAT
ncbi:plasmid stabilization protein [Lysobacter sp. A289]